MSKNKKDIDIDEVNEQINKLIDHFKEVNIVAGINSINYIQTKEKGIFIWGPPVNANFEDHYKMIDLIKFKTKEKEINVKKQEEEAKKESELKYEEEKEVD